MSRSVAMVAGIGSVLAIVSVVAMVIPRVGGSDGGGSAVVAEAATGPAATPSAATPSAATPSAATPGATAGPTPGAGDGRRIAENTEALDVVIAEVMEIDEALDGVSPEQGLSSMAVDVEARRLRIWWVGEVPPELAVLPRESDVVVEIRPGRFRNDTLEEAMTRLSRTWQRKYPQGLDGCAVTSVGLMADGSGLTVGIAFADFRRHEAPPRIPEPVIAAARALADDVPVIEVRPTSRAQAAAAVDSRRT